MLNPGASHPEISGHGAPFSFPQFAKGAPARPVREVAGQFPNSPFYQALDGGKSCHRQLFGNAGSNGAIPVSDHSELTPVWGRQAQPRALL